MKITHSLCDNWFPPTQILCSAFRDENFLETTYRCPDDEKYDSTVFGRWRVKYKKIDFAFWCEGQKHLHS
jgi:hypothetical protein